MSIAMDTDSAFRKISYPTLLTKSEHDFRRGYKGSILEKKFRKIEKKENRIQATLRSLADWILPRRKGDVKEAAGSPIERVPNEILHQILKQMDEKSAVCCRRVCRRWHNMTGYITRKGGEQKDITVSRLVISSSRKGLELRRVSYDTQKGSLLIIPWSQINNFVDLGYSFRRFSIHRIIIQDIVLTDRLVDFVRLQLGYSDLKSVIHFSLHKVDFSEANSLTLHKLLAPVAKTIECLEITQCYGMRADSLTDSHLAQLDSRRLRRVNIDGVRFAALRRAPALKIGNASLRHFSEVENFPVLVLDRCSVTTDAVCRYTQLWLEHLNTETGICTAVCTVKRCIYVDCEEFEEECRKKGIAFKHRRGSGSMTMYSVGKRGHRQSLSLQISPPEKEAEEKKDLTS